MTSGGDAAGMNPAIKSAVDHARQLGMNPYVVYDGLEGLIDGKIKEATRELTSDMIYRGGTLLRSSRSKRFFDYEFRKQAYEHLKARDINKLIIMG
ncbi:MAG: 6-phosphofructokinase, partial [Akkermansia sp.]